MEFWIKGEIKKIIVHGQELSELAVEGTEIVGKQAREKLGEEAGKLAERKLINEGTPLVGKQLMDEGLEGIAKLKKKNVEGLDAKDGLIHQIYYGAIDPKGFNVGQVKGALANAQIAARPEYINDVTAVAKKIKEPFGSTDMDIALRTGKIIETKNSYALATLTKGSDQASKFVEQITILVRYQKKYKIDAGVEIVSKEGFSEEALRLLTQTRGKLDYPSLTWREI